MPTSEPDPECQMSAIKRPETQSITTSARLQEVAQAHNLPRLSGKRAHRVLQASSLPLFLGYTSLLPFALLYWLGQVSGTSYSLGEV